MGRPQAVGHWHTLFEGFATSSLDFYEMVKAGIAHREIPDLKISQVEWKESGLGSGKRIYLRVSREGLNFDICAAPFGKGFFFSWWLARIPRILLDFAFIFALPPLPRHPPRTQIEGRRLHREPQTLGERLRRCRHGDSA